MGAEVGRLPACRLLVVLLDESGEHRSHPGRQRKDLIGLVLGHQPQHAHHLGRGVCYELNVLHCELLRRVGVPAAVAVGWTLGDGALLEPDHLWAMALLPSPDGPR